MKSNTYLLGGLCMAAVIFTGSFTASAQFKKSTPSPSPKASASPSVKPSATPAEKAPRAIPFHGTASAVDQSAKTFTIAGKKDSRVFKVTDKTTITKAGSSATLADLPDNEAVTGSYWKQEDGTLELKTLKIGGKTDAEKSTSGKKSKKEDDAAVDASSSASPSASPKE
jgi:hypothetical protein